MTRNIAVGIMSRPQRYRTRAAFCSLAASPADCVENNQQKVCEKDTPYAGVRIKLIVG